MAGRHTGAGRRTTAALAAGLLALPLSAARPAERDGDGRSAVVDLDWDGTVQRVRPFGRDGCRLDVTVDAATVATRDGRTRDATGVGHLAWRDCPDGIGPDTVGAPLRATTRLVLHIASSSGGNPDGVTATSRRVVEWRDPLEIASSQGGTPDGYRVRLEIASSQGTNPDG